MRAPRLTPEERREVERFGIHGDDALKAHVERVVRGLQLVLAAVGGVLILVILGGAVLVVAFQ